MQTEAKQTTNNIQTIVCLDRKLGSQLLLKTVLTGMSCYFYNTACTTAHVLV